LLLHHNIVILPLVDAVNPFGEQGETDDTVIEPQMPPFPTEKGV